MFPYKPEMFHLYATTHATQFEAAWFSNMGFWTGAVSGILVTAVGIGLYVAIAPLWTWRDKEEHKG